MYQKYQFFMKRNKNNWKFNFISYIKIDDYMIHIAQKHNTCPVPANVLGLILSTHAVAYNLPTGQCVWRRGGACGTLHKGKDAKVN